MPDSASSSGGRQRKRPRSASNGKARRRREGGQDADGKRRRSSRERRGRRRREDGTGGAVPPQDWRGPGMGAVVDPRAPPQEWRGPQWGGAPGYPQPPPGYYPPPPGYPGGPPPGTFGASPAPPPGYGPPPGSEWGRGGAAMRSGYPEPPPGQPWQPPGAGGVLPPPGWGGAARPPQGDGFPGYAAPGTGKAPAAGQMPGVAGAAGAPPPAGGQQQDKAEEEEEDDLPPEPTVAEKLRGIPLVRAALSERMITRLKTSGVLDDDPEKQPPWVEDKSDAASEAPAVVAAVKARCARLGLDGTAAAARARPALQLGAPRLPPCTLGLALHQGLWERFQQCCGTPLPAEVPPVPCQLRPSGGGGQVVVPCLTQGAAVSTAAA